MFHSGDPGFNSPLDILLELSTSFPRRSSLNLNIKRFFIQNEKLQIEGEVKGGIGIAKINNVLKAYARDGKVQNIPTQLKAKPGWKSFGFSLKVNRQTGDL